MSTAERCGSNASTHAVGSGNAATRVFVVPWSQRLTFAKALAAAAHPDIAYCWCRQIKIDPIMQEQPADETGAGGMINYPAGFAQITAEYGTDWAIANHWPSDIPKPAHCAGTGLTLRMQYAGEFLRIPAREARWADNYQADPELPVPDDESMCGRLLVQGAQYDLDWQYLVDPPIQRLREATSKVNEDEFLGCDPGTLLFLGFDLSAGARFDLDAPGAWNLMLKFQERRIEVGQNVYGWNHEYRGEDGWQEVVMFDGQQWGPRHKSAAFAELLACNGGGEPEEPPE